MPKSNGYNANYPTPDGDCELTGDLLTLEKYGSTQDRMTLVYVCRLLDSKLTASREYLFRVLKEHDEQAARMDDGYLCTCALEALPIDPSMLKRRKAA